MEEKGKIKDVKMSAPGFLAVDLRAILSPFLGSYRNHLI